MNQLDKKIPPILEDIQNNLLKKAKKLLEDNLAKASNLKDMQKEIKNKKIVLAPLCNKAECEDMLKFKTGGAKVLNILDGKKPDGKCIVCGKKADYLVYIAKSY